MLAGLIVWGVGLALLPSAHPVAALTVLGLFRGLPVGVIMALPAEVLHPASRAIGTGLFYTGLDIGHAGLPPLAGWLQNAFGRCRRIALFRRRAGGPAAGRCLPSAAGPRRATRASSAWLRHGRGATPAHACLGST
jgi:hypothetical protein